ncbi:hypothetical protein WDZ11_22880 (plasmid) [Roseomonas mucosa]
MLAVSSETGGLIVLQADSGPIAGARLIGSFNRAGQSNRLVVRVTRVQYQGQTIQADGIVVAPDSMETAVATNVDQRMLERFVLPAAAAFIAGLGQAVATHLEHLWAAQPPGWHLLHHPPQPGAAARGRCRRRRAAGWPGTGTGGAARPDHPSRRQCTGRDHVPTGSARRRLTPGRWLSRAPFASGWTILRANAQQDRLMDTHLVAHPDFRPLTADARGPGGPVEPRCAAGASAAA